jgi:ABC-type nitrate/sulfonate/bicarbonate transport system substrate-binding protein
VLKQLKTKKDQVIRFQNQGNLLFKQVAQLEESEEDRDLVEALKEANKYQEKNREKHEALADELMKAKELEDEHKQRRAEIDDLLAPDEEENEDLDAMMKEYEDEVKDEIALGFKDADKNIITPNKTPVAQTNTAKPQQKKDENFDSLMADLMN